jgi:hypothetical protein
MTDALWSEEEEDGETALGEPHHFHNIEMVALRCGAPDADAVG